MYKLTAALILIGSTAFAGDITNGETNAVDATLADAGYSVTNINNGFTAVQAGTRKKIHVSVTSSGTQVAQSEQCGCGESGLMTTNVASAGEVISGAMAVQNGVKASSDLFN